VGLLCGFKFWTYDPVTMSVTGKDREWVKQQLAVNL
jgi:hypothetical protein